jgi:hypothetical protein
MGEAATAGGPLAVALGAEHRALHEVLMGRLVLAVAAYSAAIRARQGIPLWVAIDLTNAGADLRQLEVEWAGLVDVADPDPRRERLRRAAVALDRAAYPARGEEDERVTEVAAMVLRMVVAEEW